MKVGIVLCIILTLAALESGDMFITAVFGGFSVLLIYLKVTEKERQRRKAWELKKKAAEDLRAQGNQRFGNSSFAKMVVHDLQLSNWTDLNDVNGVRILFEEIVTPSRKYRYIDYGLAKLDVKGTQEFADYISSFYHGDDIKVSQIVKTVGGYSGGFSGYVGSDGTVSVSADWSGYDKVEGYMIYKVCPKYQPQGAKW